MERDHVRDKGVATPGGDHVKVEEGSDGTEKGATLLEGLDPSEKGEHEQEDGNGFVVVRAGDGTGNVTGNDTNESCCKKTGTFVLHFLGKPGNMSRRLMTLN